MNVASPLIKVRHSPNSEMSSLGIARPEEGGYRRWKIAYSVSTLSVDTAAPQVLRLFTASQLEIAVAGEPVFDLAFWKEHTEYKGFRPDDATVEFFWKVRTV